MYNKKSHTLTRGLCITAYSISRMARNGYQYLITIVVFLKDDFIVTLYAKVYCLVYRKYFFS